MKNFLLITCLMAFTGSATYAQEVTTPATEEIEQCYDDNGLIVDCENSSYQNQDYDAQDTEYIEDDSEYLDDTEYQYED